MPPCGPGKMSPHAHWPSSQRSPALHIFLQPPQLRGSVWGLMQPMPEQQDSSEAQISYARPLEHAQRPPRQASLSSQTVPQPPQLRGSLRTSRQTVTPVAVQHRSLGSHRAAPQVQRLSAQVSSGAHAMPQPPQWFGACVGSMQRPSQQTSPDTQRRSPQTPSEVSSAEVSVSGEGSLGGKSWVVSSQDAASSSKTPTDSAATQGAVGRRRRGTATEALGERFWVFLVMVWAARGLGCG